MRWADFNSRHNIIRAIVIAAIFGAIIGMFAVLWRQRQLETIQPVGKTALEKDPERFWENVDAVRKSQGLPPLPPEDRDKAIRLHPD